ncbi:MAG: hypothetical protein PWP51_2146 [Clostridiales bacterium]|jgi:hypothetical protein|nr:hypothetical protein [Clostridiales bacterium]
MTYRHYIQRTAKYSQTHWITMINLSPKSVAYRHEHREPIMQTYNNV